MTEENISQDPAVRELIRLFDLSFDVDEEKRWMWPEPEPLPTEAAVRIGRAAELGKGEMQAAGIEGPYELLFAGEISTLVLIYLTKDIELLEEVSKILSSGVNLSEN